MSPSSAGNQTPGAPRLVIAATSVFLVVALLGLIDLHRAVDGVSAAYEERLDLADSIYHASLARSLLAAREFESETVTAELTESLEGLNDLLSRREPDEPDDAGADPDAPTEPPSTIVALARYSRTGLVAALALSRDEPGVAERHQWIARQSQRLDQSLGLLGQLVIETDATRVAARASRRASAVVFVVGLLGLAAIAFQAWCYRVRRRG